MVAKLTYNVRLTNYQALIIKKMVKKNNKYM